MPYANIVFIKVLWKELLHDDDRFIGQLNDDQKGLYLMLLILAGATTNNIKDDEIYLKRVLNLQFETPKIRQNLDKILQVFPKLVSKDGYLKFKNFNRIHNYIRKSQGVPKELQGIAKNRIEKSRVEKIREAYVKVKGLSLKDFSPNDYARTGKAIITLIARAGDNDQLILDAIRWISKKDYQWTLETIDKKWADFMSEVGNIPESMRKYIKK